jgi:alpha-D-xyloside xylohydrolase
MPYLLKTSREAHEKGIPVLRAMFLEFPDDPSCAYLDRQYMLGEDLLAAPVFSEDNVVTYYLPKGEWKHLITGEKVKNDQGAWRTETHNFFSLPLWAREGASL